MTTKDDAKQEAKTEDQDPKPSGLPQTQEELNRIIADRVARAKPADYDDMKAELQAIKDKDLSESQLAAQRAEKAESELAAERSQRLRLEVAIEKGLKPSQAARLVGTSREELEADADAFLADIKPSDDAKAGGGSDPVRGRNPAQDGQEGLTDDDQTAAWARGLFGVDE